jgi:toxin ParE1/3/4
MTPVQSLNLLATAERDIEQAMDWYDEQRPGLGDEFFMSLEELIDRIEHDPELHPIVVGTSRRAVLGSFPYLLVYRVLNDRIEVVGVFHSQVGPIRIAARSRSRGISQ